MIRLGLGSSRSIGLGLGSGKSSGAAATSWYLSGGVDPANCIAAYQPKGAASYAASKINLANPGTYDAFEGVAPAWAAGTGWTGDGATTYLRTGITPAVGWSMIAKFANLTAVVLNVLCGCVTPWTKRFYLLARDIGANHQYAAGDAGGYLQIGAPLTAGRMAIAVRECYLNGVSEGTLPVQTVVCDSEIFVCGIDPPVWFMAGELHAAAFYNIDIAPYMAALDAAMAAL